MRRQQQAFTLVELLVVMAIMALLGTMLFAMIGSADDKNNELETDLLISRLVAASEQFENLTGDIALPTGDRTDPLSGSWYPSSNTGTWENQQLWWRFSTEMTDADRTAAEANALTEDIKADPYQSESYLKNKYPTLSGWQRIAKKEEALDVVSDAEADDYKGTHAGSWGTVTNATALANGASGDVPDPYDGHFTKRGTVKRKILLMRGAIARDIGMRKYQTMPILEVNDIGKDFLEDDTVKDLWGNPLIYIAHSTRGVKYVKPWRWGCNALAIGANPGGRIEVDDRNQDGVANDKDWIVEPTVNKKGDWDESGAIDSDDWDNMLYNARPSNGRGVYIASAGEDGLFDCRRTQPVNEDNIENKLEDQ